MLKLPEIKKAINKFLTSEDGKISKKAVIGVGALIALAASANKVKAECTSNWDIVCNNIYPAPPGFQVVTNICATVHSNGQHYDQGNNGCNIWTDAWCSDVTHSNNLQIVPKTGEIIATHAHSVGTAARHASSHTNIAATAT